MRLTGRSRLGLLVAVWAGFCAFSLAHGYRADAAAIGVDAAEQHPTTTTVSCEYQVENGMEVPFLCAVYVVDQSATPTIPTGTVRFTASTGGLGGTSCRLESSSSSDVGFCVFNVTRADYLVYVTGSYAGDATHAAGSGTALIGCPSPPQLTGVTQSASTWAEGPSPPHTASAKPPVGTVFAYTLDRPAQVRFLFTHTVTGRRVGGRCVAQTNLNRRKVRCLRTVRLAFSRQAQAGRTRLHFEGRLNPKRKLAPGFYRLIITATSNGLLSKPANLRFTILR